MNKLLNCKYEINNCIYKVFAYTNKILDSKNAIKKIQWFFDNESEINTSW